MTPIETLWQTIRHEAEDDRHSEGEFRLIRIDPNHPFEIYAGVHANGPVLLAIGVTQRPPAIDADTGALGYFRHQRAGGSWLMALRLSGSGLEQVFGRLCQDLIDTAAHVATETALVSLFRDRLLLWKRLFRDGNAGLLEKFQIKGLIAELLSLESFISSHPDDPCLPVIAWIGPCGGDQDFLFSNQAVEVKAVSPGSEKVSIASAAQLDASVPLELRVHVLREASPSEAGAITLPVLVSRIESLIADRSDALHIYRDKLLEAGYVENEYYQSIAYTLMDIRRYDVSKSFPKIVNSALPEAIPDVTYSILFSSIVPYLIAENCHAT
jgi:hypothetical protein